jgi:hypothetical protein
MEDKIQQYLSDGKYLPDFMKDFHDQKDLFKAIYAQYSEGNNKKLLNDVNWVDAHCFTIDVFLWWMGSHGYKLQKVRNRHIKFYDKNETIKYFTDLRKSVSLNIYL